MQKADWENAGFGLYLHWPFCQSKCPYCDFNSHVATRIDQRRWAEAYLLEIERAGDLTSDRRLDSVYFGGGTPSLMDPDTVSAILDAVRTTWRVANDWEVTLEANPTSVETGRFMAYRQAGVNRVSLGVQALNDTDLRRLGRLHTAAEAMQAFDIARTTFDRVSFDLIYARQDQTMESWQAELDRALAFAIDHLSLYQLTIEPGTAFGERFAKGGLSGLPDEDLAADLYDYTVETCAASGLYAYEVSNFAAPEFKSRHNILYWSGGDYLGIGPGAHGRITLEGARYATVSESTPGGWLNRSTSAGVDTTTWEALTGQEQFEEYLMMGLRVAEGISMTRALGLYKDPALPGKINRLIHEGLLETDTDHLRATERGRVLLNAVLRELLG